MLEIRLSNTDTNPQSYLSSRMRANTVTRYVKYTNGASSLIIIIIGIDTRTEETKAKVNTPHPLNSAATDVHAITHVIIGCLVKPKISYYLTFKEAKAKRYKYIPLKLHNTAAHSLPSLLSATHSVFILIIIVIISNTLRFYSHYHPYYQQHTPLLFSLSSLLS